MFEEKVDEWIKKSYLFLSRHSALCHGCHNSYAQVQAYIAVLLASMLK